MPITISGLTSPTISNYQGGVATGGTATNVSGTSVSFTSIPTWVKRITFMMYNVYSNGSSNIEVRLGSGSLQSSGYTVGSFLCFASSGLASLTSSTGFTLQYGGSTQRLNGAFTFGYIGSNVWSGHGNIYVDGSRAAFTGGSVALSGTLDRIGIATVNGSDTFAGGTVNIVYD